MDNITDNATRIETEFDLVVCLHQQDAEDVAVAIADDDIDKRLETTVRHIQWQLREMLDDARVSTPQILEDLECVIGLLEDARLRDTIDFSIN